MVNCEKVWMEDDGQVWTDFPKTAKIMPAVFLAAGMFLLTSCNGSQGEKSGSTVSIQKDGTILSHIEESFAQDYYDLEELRQAILVEAAHFNKAAGSE